MRIQIDNEVRDMTPEEEAAFLAWQEGVDPPDKADDADYEAALSRLGVEI